MASSCEADEIPYHFLIRLFPNIPRITLNQGLCNIRHPPQTNLKLKSRDIIFCTECIAKLSNRSENLQRARQCPAQIFKRIWQLKWMLWTKQILRNLSLSRVWDGYPKLHSPTDFLPVVLAFLLQTAAACYAGKASNNPPCLNAWHKVRWFNIICHTSV